MRKTSSFFCGMAVMALLVSITGTALAASNAISFNTANLSINGKRIVDKGDVLESSAGAERPYQVLRPETEQIHSELRSHLNLYIV